jgi:hypothetical protein
MHRGYTVPELVGGIVAIGFVVLWIYCIVDVITTDDAIVRHLPKIVWLLIVVLVPDIGSLLWLGLGRPRVWTQRPQAPGRRPAVALATSIESPLDDPSLDTLSPTVRWREEQARLRVWETQLKRREEDLRRKLEGGPTF